MNSEQNNEPGFEQEDFSGEAGQLRAEGQEPGNPAAGGPLDLPSEARREDNRDEYYYQAPKEDHKFEGTQQQGQTPPPAQNAAPNSDIRYDYFKSYPSYGPGAPYGDHERGAEQKKADDQSTV